MKITYSLPRYNNKLCALQKKPVSCLPLMNWSSFDDLVALSPNSNFTIFFIHFLVSLKNFLWEQANKSIYMVKPFFCLRVTKTRNQRQWRSAFLKLCLLFPSLFWIRKYTHICSAFTLLMDIFILVCRSFGRAAYLCKYTSCTIA